MRVNTNPTDTYTQTLTMHVVGTYLGIWPANPFGNTLCGKMKASASDTRWAQSQVEASEGWRRVESVELRLGIVYCTISYKRHARSGSRRRRRWRRLRRCRHLFHLICNINIKAKLWKARQTDADSDVDFNLGWNATGAATTTNSWHIEYVVAPPGSG